jgi:hypothetical protein
MSFLPSLSPGNVTQRLPTGFKFDNDLTWDRPTGWLDLGINTAYGATGVPEKIKGLVAIHPNDIAPAHNYVAFHCDTSDDSNLLVDWGDGNLAETGHQSDFSSDVDGYSVSSHGSLSQSGTYNGKTGVLVYLNSEGRDGIRNTNVDLCSGNNYTLTFDYYAAPEHSGRFWGVEYSYANRVSIASNAPPIETGVWTGVSLTIPSTRPSSSSIEYLQIRPQATADNVYGAVNVTGEIGFQNVKVVVDNSGSGYYVKENKTNHHVYDHDIITGDTSTAKSTLVRGYKQAMFEISLQGSAKFTVIDLNENGPFTTHANYVYRKGQPILDIFASSSNATNITLGDSIPLTMCEQVEVRNTSSNRLTTPRYLYAGMKRLQSIPFVPWIYNAGTRDYLYVFAHCQALRFLPDDFASQDKFWFKNPTRLQQAFDSCWNLQYLPEGIFGTSELSSSTSYHAMFRDCRKLKYIPHLGIRTGSGSDTRLDYMFYNCLLLTKIPKGFSLQRAHSSHGIDRIFINNRNIKDWSSIFDGTTDVLGNINHTSLDMTQTFYGWHSMVEFPFIGQFTKCTDAEGIFNNNHMVQRFSPLYTHLDFSNAISIRVAFNANYCLEELPEIKVRALGQSGQSGALTSAFQSCRALTSIKITGMISGASDGEYYRMFYGCFSLNCIDGVDFSFAGETSDYYQMFHICRDINAIKFPGTFRAGYASPRINVTISNYADVSGEYQINAAGTGYDYTGSGSANLSVSESGGNYTWTLDTGGPTFSSSASSNTQYTPWAADWSGASETFTFTEVITGFKYTVSGNSGDGLRYSPIKRTQMLEIFNQLHTVGYTATLDIRNNSYTADLTDADKAIATDKGWTLSL